MRNVAVSRIRAVTTKVVIGVTLLGSIGVAYAFKSIFARPGEDALAMIPSNAVFAGSLDLSPSPQQALAFKHIDDAMARNGMDHFVETSILDVFGKSPGLDALKPFVLRSGAVGYIPTGKDKETSALMLIALTDPTEAQKVLDKYGRPGFFRGTKYVSLKGTERACMRIIGDFLAVGELPIAIHDVRLVAEHQMPSLLTVPEFVEARGRVASDANVMAFFNPSLLGDSGVAALKTSKASWLSMGLAIRDGGVALSVWNQWDPASIKGLQQFSQTREIRRDLFQTLPSGAYGMFVVSQPASYYHQFNDVANDVPSQKDVSQDMRKHVQDDLGMDLDKDLIAACEGTAVIAAYPSRSNDPAGVDMLVVMDDQNGAKPAAALAKFQAHIEAQLAKEPGSPPLWVSNDVEGAREFKLADKAQQDMRDGVGNGIDPNLFKKDLLMDGKTLIWASVGDAVIASTNKDLLQRAIVSYRNRVGNLASDTEFLKSDTEVLDGSQVLALFNIGRMARGIGNTVNTAKMEPENAKSFKSITDAFGKLIDPFYLKAKVQPDGQVAVGAFIPIDYDQVFDMLGKDKPKK